MLGICLVLAFSWAGITLFLSWQAFRRMEWRAEVLDRMTWQMLHGQEVLARRFSQGMHEEQGQSLTGLQSMWKRMDDADFEINRA